MKDFIIKGNILYSRTRKELICQPNSYLLCLDGCSGGVFSVLPEQYRGLPLIDFGDRLIIPGMTDLHLHASQFAYRGLGMDMELLDWLQERIFPEEARFASLDYADRAYSDFADRLLHTSTTRAAVFATVHTSATQLLMDKLEKTGLYTYVGKVNMDRNCPTYLMEKSSEQSLADTKAWLASTMGKYTRTKPILTPRFIPNCSEALLAGLQELVQQYGLAVQSHLSENLSEIELVRQLCPWAKSYGEAYDRFGLLGGAGPCIMAHCVYSEDEELERLRKNGVFVAHSPESNCNLSSGIAPIRRYLESGIRVGLATDVAAGSHENMLRAITHAIQVSKLRWRLLDGEDTPLSFAEAFYMATLGGGAFFGKVGSFEAGYAFDAVVLDDSTLTHPQELTPLERLERMAYLSDDRHIYAKYVSGSRVL